MCHRLLHPSLIHGGALGGARQRRVNARRSRGRGLMKSRSEESRVKPTAQRGRNTISGRLMLMTTLLVGSRATCLWLDRRNIFAASIATMLYCCEARCFVDWSDGCGVAPGPFKRLSALAGAGRLPFVAAFALRSFDRATLASRFLSSSCCAEAHSGLAATESGSAASTSGVRSYANAT